MPGTPNGHQIAECAVRRAAGRNSACGRCCWPSLPRRLASIRFVNAPGSTIGPSPPRSGTGSTRANTGSTSGSPPIPPFKSRGCSVLPLVWRLVCRPADFDDRPGLVGLAAFRGLCVRARAEPAGGRSVDLVRRQLVARVSHEPDLHVGRPVFRRHDRGNLVLYAGRAAGNTFVLDARGRQRRDGHSGPPVRRRDRPGPGRRVVHRSGTEASLRRLCPRPVGTRAGRRLANLRRMGASELGGPFSALSRRTLSLQPAVLRSAPVAGSGHLRIRGALARSARPGRRRGRLPRNANEVE